jgi:hypothetical protein
VGFSGLREAMLRQKLMTLTSKLVMLLWSIMFMSSIIEWFLGDFLFSRKKLRCCNLLNTSYAPWLHSALLINKLSC